jgi:hypothetical protein
MATFTTSVVSVSSLSLLGKEQKFNVILDYMNNHPGGSQLLKKVYGRNGTEMFLANHASRLINEPKYAALKIGRLMEERQPEDIREDEIVLHSFVFRIRGKYFIQLPPLLEWRPGRLT